MEFRRFKLRLWVLAAVAVLMAAGPSEAQPPATNAWQSIIFSSPSNSESSSNLTSPIPTEPTFSPDLQSRLRMFQDSSPVVFHTSPLPEPAPMPRQVLRVHKPSHDNLPWEFMSPAEILGVAPDQILQTQGRNTNGDQSSLTAIERLLQQRNPDQNLQGAAATNGSLSTSQNFWSDANSDSNGVMAGLFSSSLNTQPTAAYGPAVNGAAPDNLFASPHEKSEWSELFGTPTPSSAPDSSQQLEQQEDMKQFMQLLNRGSGAATATTASSDETPFFNTTTALSDFNSTAPVANPLGGSLEPLTSGIGKPASLAPLPTVIRQDNGQSAVKPTWTPQPPPWLSPTPQPFAIPRRKF